MLPSIRRAFLLEVLRVFCEVNLIGRGHNANAGLLSHHHVTAYRKKRGCTGKIMKPSCLKMVGEVGIRILMPVSYASDQ